MTEDESQAVIRLLDQVGNKSTCRACGKTIWFVLVRSGKVAPYNSAAQNHFAECPQAKNFRRNR